MWVQKLPSGRYKYYERYKDPRSGAWHTTTITLDNNRRMDKRDAETALRARIRASTALVDNYATVTMKGLVDDYRASQKGLVKPQTAEGNYRKLKKVIEKLGEDTLASKLTAPYVRKCLAAEKPSTYNERLKVFKAMMRWAYREELVSDISYLEKLPKRKDAPTRVKVQDKFLEKDELKNLLDGMKVEHWRLVTEFLALSGLRIGEAIALRKEDVTDHIHVDKTYSKILDRITEAGVKITDKEVEDYYEANKERFVGEATVNASHILVDTEELALELLAKINAGEISFEDCARENSSCPSKENGGNLGDFGQGQMVPEFDQAVFAMEVGTISAAPVKTQFGYHLIKLNSKSEATVAPLAEIKPQLTEMLLNEKRRSAYESKINQLKIMYPVDLA